MDTIFGSATDGDSRPFAKSDIAVTTDGMFVVTLHVQCSRTTEYYLSLGEEAAFHIFCVTCSIGGAICQCVGSTRSGYHESAFRRLKIDGSSCRIVDAYTVEGDFIFFGTAGYFERTIGSRTCQYIIYSRRCRSYRYIGTASCHCDAVSTSRNACRST